MNAYRPLLASHAVSSLKMLASWCLLVVLGACGSSASAPAQPTQLQSAKETTVVLSLSRKATLEADGSGNASYFCRRVVCAGDNANDQGVRGFLEFSLAQLPPQLQSAQIMGATLRLYQNSAEKTYTALGSLHIEHLHYGSQPLFDSPILSSLTQSRMSAEGFIQTDALKAVRSDWDNRTTRDYRSQYRLRMEKTTNADASGNLVLFGASEPSETAAQLVVRYRLP